MDYFQFLVFLAMLTACITFFVWTFSLLGYFLWPWLLVDIFQRWNIYRAGFTSKVVFVGDFKFCYMERGSASGTNETIVLIHGFAASKDAWCYMSHAIPKTEHIIALDLPGHGKSTRKHDGDHTIPSQVSKLHQFIHAIGLHQRKFHLAGISMGGHIVGVYASQHPSNLSSVIMMCPAGIDAPHLSEFLEDVLLKGERNYLIPETPEDFLTMWKKIKHREIHLPYFVAKLFTDVKRPFNEFYKKVLLEITHPDHRFLLQNVLEDITVPALVLWGEHDKLGLPVKRPVKACVSLPWTSATKSAIISLLR